MNKELMATLLAKLAYKSKKSETDPEFAAQLFIENLVLPEEIDGYTEGEIKKYILDFLNRNNF